MSAGGPDAFFYEIFHPSLPRQGPGEDVWTEKAFSLLEEHGLGDRPHVSPATNEPPRVRILDVGCGAGAQTLVLARRPGVHVTAIDNHQPFLDELERRAQAAGLENIDTLLQDMASMDPKTLGREPFDLVWAEGSLFIMGFGEALRTCRPLLKPEGRLAASELTWFRPDPPEECAAYFAAVYPALTDVPGNLALAADAGFAPVAHFALPESAWVAAYYEPLAARVEELRGRHADDRQKLEMLAVMDQEIEMYRRYSAYYGYVFYLMRRDDTET